MPVVQAKRCTFECDALICVSISASSRILLCDFSPRFDFFHFARTNHYECILYRLLRLARPCTHPSDEWNLMVNQPGLRAPQPVNVPALSTAASALGETSWLYDVKPDAMMDIRYGSHGSRSRKSQRNNFAAITEETFIKTPLSHNRQRKSVSGTAIKVFGDYQDRWNARACAEREMKGVNGGTRA